jgi:hypothetical protein
LLAVYVAFAPAAPPVPAAMLLVGCGVAVEEGLGIEVEGLLASAVESASLPQPQLFQLSQLFELPALGQPQPVPVRQPLAEETANTINSEPTINDRENDTFMLVHPCNAPRNILVRQVISFSSQRRVMFAAIRLATVACAARASSACPQIASD